MSIFEEYDYKRFCGKKHGASTIKVMFFAEYFKSYVSPRIDFAKGEMKHDLVGVAIVLFCYPFCY